MTLQQLQTYCMCNHYYYFKMGHNRELVCTTVLVTLLDYQYYFQYSCQPTQSELLRTKAKLKKNIRLQLAF